MRTLLIALAALLIAGCGDDGIERSIRYRSIGDYEIIRNPETYRVQVFCDTERGHLIYQTAGKPGGISVVPNGCPRKDR